MPTPKLFAQCPDFPSTVPMADLPVLSLSKIGEHDGGEEKRLFDACREYGFFLLDLKASQSGDNLLRDAEHMFDLTAATLGLEESELSTYAYNPPRDLLGYKCAGKLRTDDGKLDAMKMYMLGQDDIIGNIPPRNNPDTIETRRKECQEFFRHAHAVVAVILAALDRQLDLQPGTLERLSPLDKLSDTSLRLLLSHPQSIVDENRISLGGHTDIGTVTLLFHVAGGLQILPAGSENVHGNWRYIRPEPGCALVNIGDTLVEWTGGLLRSSLHRVVTAPGAQASVPRQSLAYLIRPDRNASMRRLEGSALIPRLKEGEQEETRSVSEWATWRAQQIMNGELKPQTRGGNPIQA
ncbi:oxidoreductase [Melanomma pulvis-pyrius CBS 109.77]|uniref:Oxidoreductase n=1 Tax=Melanomma pulvis-pyrius CBS 109.77 TaxID=1314802 RepID=A0A6A6WPS8_9PLEO|nr:oxidoreductase [Melanomma pulvis-pyrius CBS 109.77]